MTEVLFLTSVQDEQVERVRNVAEKVRQRLPGIDVKVVEGPTSKDLMAKHKIQFGPAVVIDGRLEYVGIPRVSMLVDRILQVREGRGNPRTAAEKVTAAPPPKPAAASTPPAVPKPGAPPAPPSPDSA